ncbi:glycosyltransferase [Polynucleobacter sp. MG-27-Goln-C1]|nr:glycosyltransferase [Polynucleobacter sp. MG-27-Goln-C1]
MLIDSFIFFNELDLLDIRLNILADKVDLFVLVEGKKTFQGADKPLHFSENKDRYGKFLNKIVHIVVDDYPGCGTPFEREHFQREAILRGIEGIPSDSLFMLSDVDEIPNPDVIPSIVDKNSIVLFNQKQFYYKLNLQCVERGLLPGSVLINLVDLVSPSKLRIDLFNFQSRYITGTLVDANVTLIENGGWHFSFLGDVKKIQEKIEAFSHDEFNLEEIKEDKNLSESIQKGLDIFGRNFTYKRVELMEMPFYISKHLDEYEGLGFWSKGQQSCASKDIFSKDVKNSLPLDFSRTSSDSEMNERRRGLIKSLNETISNWEAWNADLQKIIYQRDSRIIDLQDRAHNLSVWGKNLQTTIDARDNQIINLMQDIERVSKWALDLQYQYDQKHSELMKMSDWAASMRLELEKRRLSIKFQFTSLAKLVLRRSFQKLKIAKLVARIKQAFLRWKKNTKIGELKAILKGANGGLIIVFPVIVWDFRWQRPQHLVSRFCKRGYAILYSAMSLIPNGNRFASRSEASSKMTLDELQKGIFQFWPSSKEHVNIYQDQLKDDDVKNIADGIATLILDLNPKSISYVVHFPSWWPIVEKLQSEFGGKIIFDCMDDHGGFSTNSISALEAEKILIEKADLLITSSQLLYDKMNEKNGNCIQVKNGTEFEHFYGCMPNGELDFLGGGPIIGYFGAISDWFDVELIAHCARMRPQYNFVLIGSTFGAEINEIEDLENVFLLGEKAYQSLPGYLAYFDVCLIPFKLIPLTMATNPVKFYEYLSAGKPVVSVRLPELIEYVDCCYLADNAEEFVAQIDEAYQSKDDFELKNMRLELARNNSWDSRVDAILKNSCFE